MLIPEMFKDRHHRPSAPRRRSAVVAAAAFAVLFALAADAAAQPAGTPVFDHPLTPAPDPSYRTAAPETLRILAAMVQFVPDDDNRTTGDGTFDRSTTASLMKDPPPRDAGYFDLHLRFLRNYFARVSDGALTVEYRLLPATYDLPSPMRDYSPPRNSADNAEIGKLAVDAWRVVDSVTPGIVYEEYDAYLLFHAGAGRDIDLVSIYGYDPTPFDIPSLYLNLSSLRAMFGESYEGIPVRGGAHHLTNSIIIPETESRTVSTIGGSVLLELGINGLLAASVGSHLGLPDLFDTKTGRTAIGRFGLMDGQSIFSWNGFIPPEPSAWEKFRLGWVTPVTLGGGESVRTLPAVGIGEKDTVYRVPVSTGEYFLVENRNRDAMRDGSTVTMVWNGDTLTRNWPRDTAGFGAFNQDSLYGIITDVDEFDWSLPGGVNTRTGEFFDGGVLIWHVDEAVIDANLATGTVNADPLRRGVDLEEADGSQDVGQDYGFLSPGSGSENGSVLDFWYDGNSAPLRVASNLFGPSSNPPSAGNNLANSHITISDFSARGPRMTARFSVGDSVVSILPGFPRVTDAAFPSGSVIAAEGGTLFAVSAGVPASIFAWNGDGTAIDPGFDPGGALPLPDSVRSRGIVRQRVAVGHLDDDLYPDIVFAAGDSSGGRLYAFELRDGDGDLSLDPVFALSLPHRVTTAPLLADSFIVVGTSAGSVFRIGFDGAVIGENEVFGGPGEEVASLALLPAGAGLIAGSSTGDEQWADGNTCAFPAGPASGSPGAGASFVAGGLLGTGTDLYAAARAGGSVTYADACAGVLPGYPFNAGRDILSSPAVADLDGDGLKDLVFFAGTDIYALNQAAALLDNFPVSVPTGFPLAGSPVVADLNGDGRAEIAGVTSEGVVFAYGPDGRMMRGFPLQAGPNSGTTPAVFYTQSTCLSCADIAVAVATGDGTVYGWKTGTVVTGPMPPPVLPWPQLAHDARNTGSESSALTPDPRSGEFLPPALTYNWPNPVGREEGYRTFIRYFVPEDARITVRIFNLAGELVEIFEGVEAAGGVDGEIAWDVSGVESGVYFARIEASGSSRSGNAVIKIAVVR